jgi:type IV pilus assembly protein PilY1
MSAALVAATLLLAPASAHAQAVVNNGLISLGVNANGALNYNGVGVQYIPTGNDGTVYGCLCEGWGVGIAGGAYDGQRTGANIASHGYGMYSSGSIGAFSSTPTTATSTTYLLDGSSNPIMSIVQTYAPSASTNLYQVTVTLTNLTSGDLGTGSAGIRYRREMDWDIAPTAFSEFVTIRRGTAANLLHSSDDGFVNSDVFTALTQECGDYSVDVDITRSGPCDHGAAFDFGFDALAAGGSKTFNLFYGAAGNEADAKAALGVVGAEVYSIASCNPSYDARCTVDGQPNTFAWGFAGVGGTPIEPSAAPEPATLVLFGTGLAGLGFARRRRKV